ncbi:acyltransferase family protein [Microvirga terrestris]|uniref:Acyltransferase n=1 Tax=Microvirga terrestris TaxID=2791024 RepID=A0ABS0HPH0_9HYPH|nr:acyltransferase [Microvirga terrestris]MBF9195366.1 acyltransferase [Microvirga terrestris]
MPGKAVQVEDLKPLTSLRFVAAIMIVLLHCLNYFKWGWLVYVPGTAVHGVSFFFVLSGFILSHVYSSRPDISYGRFIWTRFARLWPIHVAAIIFLVLTVPPGSVTFDGPGMFDKWIVLGFNLLLTHSLFPFPAYSFSWNAVSWSISTELFFYLCFPFLLKNIVSSWHWKLVVSLLPLASLALLANVVELPLGSATVETPSTYMLIYTNPLFRGFEFCLGLASWVCWKRLSVISVSRAIATIIEVAAIVLAVFWLKTGFSTYGMATLPPTTIVGQWFSVAGSSWVFAVVIIVLATGRGWIGFLLSLRPFVWLGEISFAIYMLHQILQKIFVTSLLDWHYEWVFFPLLILLSAAAHHGIELPCRKLLLSIRFSSLMGISKRASAAP